MPRAVQADRLGAARELHSRYGAVAVLKGAGTLVCRDGAAIASNWPSAIAAIPEWPLPAWATCSPASSPDCARSAATARSAARLGVLVHALAGDSAAQGGQRGLIASDVIAELRGWVNP